jgi:hypothetical protein
MIRYSPSKRENYWVILCYPGEVPITKSGSPVKFKTEEGAREIADFLNDNQIKDEEEKLCN